jgi:hypothetical protein
VNTGTLDGLAYNQWRYYRPEMIGVAGATGNPIADAPVFDPTYPQTQRGRWILDDGLIRGWVQLGFVGTFQPGSGTYLFRLPYPAHRPHATLPVVIGTGIWYWSFTDPNKNVPVVPILADPAWRDLLPSGTSNGGSCPDPDNWFQLQAPYSLRFGTGSTSGSPQTGTMTHNLGVIDTTKINAGDIQVTITGPTNTNNCEPPFISSHASTGNSSSFQFQAAPGSSIGYAWKIRQDVLTHRGNTPIYIGSDPRVPTSIPACGYRMPFDTSELTALSPYGNVFVSFRYRPAE